MKIIFNIWFTYIFDDLTFKLKTNNQILRNFKSNCPLFFEFLINGFNRNLVNEAIQISLLILKLKQCQIE